MEIDFDAGISGLALGGLVLGPLWFLSSYALFQSLSRQYAPRAKGRTVPLWLAVSLFVLLPLTPILAAGIRHTSVSEFVIGMYAGYLLFMPNICRDAIKYRRLSPEQRYEHWCETQI